MKEFQGRWRLRHFLYSKVTIVVLVVLVLLMSKALWGAYRKNSLAEAGKDQARASLFELEDQQRQLEKRVEWLSTARGQEEEIRKNFSVIAPGENLIVVVDGVGTSTNGEDWSAGESWWRRSVEAIKNWWF